MISLHHYTNVMLASAAEQEINPCTSDMVSCSALEHMYMLGTAIELASHNQ